MNVEEYFPEGLSVIHPDESHRGSKEEHHAFSAAIHCHVCYKSIRETVNNVDFMKPCRCQLMFVHTDCASRNKLKFGEAKCSSCGQGSTIPRSSKTHQVSSGPKHPNGISNQEMACSSCHDKNYTNSRDEKRKTFGKKVKPCFCRKVLHFGCLSPLLTEKSSCAECSVIYESFEPASLTQFFVKNWLWYTIYMLGLSVICTFFTIAFSNSLIFTRYDSDEDTITKEIILSLTSVFFFVVIVASVFCVMKYTLKTAIPSFRITSGKVVLKPYKTGNNDKISKKQLEPLPETDFEEIPLREIRRASQDTVEEAEEVREEPRGGYETEDMTLGQHMFGVYATHHSSSTPIEKPSLGFVFNSA